MKKVGDVRIYQIRFGYHIIKLDELKGLSSHKEVAKDIKQELQDQESIDQFYALQSKLEKVAFEYPDALDDAAKTINAKIHTTDFVSESDVPELLKGPEVLQAIQSPEVKEDGLNSEVIEVAPEHVVVVRVEDTREEKVLPLDEVREQVVASLSNERYKAR